VFCLGIAENTCKTDLSTQEKAMRHRIRQMKTRFGYRFLGAINL